MSKTGIKESVSLLSPPKYGCFLRERPKWGERLEALQSPRWVNTSERGLGEHGIQLPVLTHREDEAQRERWDLLSYRAGWQQNLD